MSGRQFSNNPKHAAQQAQHGAPAKQADGAELAAAVNRQFAKLAEAVLAPGLYVVSTPIGNLADISIRALSVLASADIALCEDTRHSRKLLSAYGIGRKLEAYHDFSGEKDRDRILASLKAGRSVALISDAGTPLLADPGFKLVRAAAEEGIGIFAVPGPSALLAALAVAGLPTDRFYFGGFLPAKQAAKARELEAARAIPGTLVFYESNARIEETAKMLGGIFPGRRIAVARELTKLFETVERGTADQVASEISAKSAAGEFVILIGPGELKPPEKEDIEKALENAMRHASLKEAVEEVAAALGTGRKIVYNLALQIRERHDDNTE